MSTSNFYSMKNFPLWAISDSDFYTKRCPECYCSFEPDADECSECNTDLSDVEPDFDEFAADEYRYELLNSIKQENENLLFHKITIRAGYYDGLQLYVHLTNYADQAGFTENGPEYVDNESCRYYLDMFRSQAIRKYQAEQRKVEKALERLGRAYGMDKLGIYARFSNGETWYTKIS